MNSEPTREEMIDIFDTIIKNSPILSGRYEQIRIVCDAIRRLIETRPRVTREFVEKWADNLNPDKLIGLHNEQAISHLWWREWQLETMFRELGYEVEEKDT